MATNHTEEKRKTPEDWLKQTRGYMERIHLECGEWNNREL